MAELPNEFMSNPHFSTTTATQINPLRGFIYAGFAVIIIKFLWNVIQNNRRYSSLPQPPLSPVMGTIFGHLEQYFYSKNKRSPMKTFAPFVFEYARKLQKEGQGMMRMKFGPFHNVILIINGKVAETVLSQRTITKPEEYQILSPLLGEGLVMTNGPVWKTARRALVPAFNQGNLNRVLPIMNRKTNVLTNIIDNLMDSSGEVVIDDLQPLMINLSIDLILETAMGIDLKAQECWAEKNLKLNQRHETPEEQYHRSLESAFDISMHRLVNPFLKNSLIFWASPIGRQFSKHVKIVREFTKKVIIARKAQIEADIKNNNLPSEPDRYLAPALDFMLRNSANSENSENSSIFDVESIIDHVTTLIFGGHDTSATTSTFFFWKIGSHPTAQKKIHEELDQIFQGDIEREITQEDIRSMTYLEACLKEALRLLPPIAMYGRHVHEDIQCGEHVIPKNATVIVLAGALQRDPLVYSEPHSFRPERFLDGKNSYRSAYLPFGYGARVCIGFTYAMQNLKVLFAQILRKYTIETEATQPKIRFSINSKVDSQVKIKFKKRVFNQ